MTEESPSRCLGYMRVSTPEQCMDRQAEGLRGLCDRLYVESASAVAAHRPVFDQVLEALEPGDSLLVWDLDRAFRSTVDAMLVSERLRKRGVALRIVKLNIDTATPEGEFFYTIIAACAQFERRILSRRTREGMAAARKRGRHIGRPRALSQQVAMEAHAWMKETGYPSRYVAALLGISRVTLERSIRRLDS